MAATGRQFTTYWLLLFKIPHLAVAGVFQDTKWRRCGVLNNVSYELYNFFITFALRLVHLQKSV